MAVSPADAGVRYLWREGFRNGLPGSASACGFVLLLVLLWIGSRICVPCCVRSPVYIEACVSESQIGTQQLVSRIQFLFLFLIQNRDLNGRSPRPEPLRQRSKSTFPDRRPTNPFVRLLCDSRSPLCDSCPPLSRFQFSFARVLFPFPALPLFPYPVPVS